VDYLLDTNICIYIANRKPTAVLSRMEKLRPGDVGMSIVTYLELVHGAWKSGRKQENLAKVQELSRLIPVQPLDTAAADRYGRVRSELERKDSPIGAYDLLIAAHTLALGLTLVTNNLREFARIPGLRLENWT
jgi:tRNA(fMet)-specific endonuclease VapC